MEVSGTRPALLLAVLVFSFMLVPQIPHAEASMTFRLHSGIIIGSDTGFTSNNGVVGGIGTSLQPYIMEGWEITSGGILISGTTAYFIIRNVYVHDVSGDSGISLSRLTNGQVANSTLANNGGLGDYSDKGISIVQSTNVLVDRNNVSSNSGGGILVSDSDLVVVSRNNVSNNGQAGMIFGIETGIETARSTRVTVTGNRLVSNDIVPSGSPFQLSSLSIASDNTVNGRPVNYYKGCTGTTVSTGPPQELIFVSCSNIHITNAGLSGAGFGVQLLSVNGADLSGDTFSNNVKGIRVYNSTGITISASSVSANFTGIEVTSSSSITMQGNSITGGHTAISLSGSDKVTISQNQLTAGVNGIYLGSSNATIVSNSVLGAKYGIDFEGSKFAANVTDNSIMNNGVGIVFAASSYLNPADTVRGNISRNLILNNGDGIDVIWRGMVYVRFILNITANNLSDNNVGMNVNAGDRIRIYHNNFISNAVQGYDTGSSWDNGYPSGGNYWSDFAGKDNCSGPRQDICPSADGIGDSQYRIGQNLDNYPLMKPLGPADTLQPVWPTGSQLSATSVGQSSVTLAWTAATDDTGILSYRLYNGNTVIATVTGVTHGFQVSGLTAGTVYTFRLQAIDPWRNNSTSDPSITLQTSTAGPSGQPAGALWQQYWPLIAAAGAAGVVLASFALLQRRRKLHHQADTTQAGIQTTRPR